MTESASTLQFNINCNSVIENKNSNVTIESKVTEMASTLPFNEIEEIKQWVVSCKIPHVHVDKLLKILRRRLLPNIPLSTTTLLEKNIKCDKENMSVVDGSSGEFLYFGVKKNLEETVDPQFHKTNILELMFNIDGVQPFGSSKVSMWPTLCKVYTQEDVYKPFSVSVYAGHGKPKSAAEYLDKFVKEMSSLLVSGVDISGKHFEVRIKFFTCDCPARSFLKCVVGHTAFKGCERCQVLGEKKDNVTVFLQTNAEKKTENMFRTFKDPHYHTGVSPLTCINPPIKMINQFILDPMHLLYLGCMKRIIEFLWNSTNKKGKLSIGMRDEINRRSIQIYKDIPDEFPRKMRPLNEHSMYKAVEFKFLTLYAAPFIMKKILPKEMYEHLLLFTISCRLLSKKIPFSHVAQARENLVKFVDDASSIYDSTFISLNIHNLVHISDDVENTGCNLNEISAFAFESYLGSMMSFLRCPLNLVTQYSRRLHEKEMYDKYEPSAPKEIEIVTETKEKIVKIKYKDMILSAEHPNSTVLLQDGSVAEICELYRTPDNRINMKYKRYLNKLPVIPDSFKVKNIWEVKKLSPDTSVSSIQQVIKKFVQFRINFSESEEKKLFCIPLLH